MDDKKLTIPQVEANVISDTKVLKAENDYLQSKYFYNVCKSAAASMKEKGQQLTNITNSRNAELKLTYAPKEKERESRIKKRFKK